MNRLYRSRTDNKMTGLCGGIADWLGLNATLVRLLVVIAAFCSFGTTMLLYFIVSLVIPKAPYGPNPYNQSYTTY
ncbi:PspC domain-containing protein [Paenibacillus validus]|uniref:PspC domain-containing protein n=1 Tax=Paenibacillus validus TaxID=44253 RepID=A0A7X2ZBN7_9BACL|nr:MULTISPECIES: PspC domain-containing protein [Paenibacillus]MED4602319.1 PspC domain-containing protein [Paenibacillus validus]MED4607198.1 PspC domain-containing protein [Paenibacillus validus]MUG71854.1 PspC domain-containing protein [Paenibacillus validus]